MRDLLAYLRKFQRFAGLQLYLNMVGMTVSSLLDGLGILMLLPMLSLIGLAGVMSNSYLEALVQPLRSLDAAVQLPAVLLIYLVLLISQASLSRYLGNRNIQLEQRFIRHIRNDVYRSLLEANWPFFLRTRKSDLTHVMTTELPRVSYGIFTFLQMVMSLLFTIVQIGIALWLSYKLTLLVLACGLLLAFINRKSFAASRSIGDEMTTLMKSYMAGMTEHFNGIKDIKSNMTERQHIDWFRALTLRMEHNVVRFSRIQSGSQFYYKLASGVFIALFVYVATAFFHAEGSMLLLIVILFSRLWPRFSQLQSSWEGLSQVVPACRTLRELQSKSEQAREFDAQNVSDLFVDINGDWRMKRGIECRDVSYQYDVQRTSYALRHIDLHIPTNSMTAIVGRSGAGKSTLIDLLIGLIEPQQGEIKVDGIPMRECAFQFRQSVSYVSQDPFLFHLSLRDNLCMGAPDATEEQLWEALRFSAADEFVRHLPDGLDTMLGDRGIRLSGGERQRIVLARAILRKPSVLILDEATSALDSENEAKIQVALERIRGSMTIIVIAHRLSTIRHADQVIVLENGGIVQRGSYNQLADASTGTFSQLLHHQEMAAADARKAAIG
ncbi:ABC transporter ATP-binding protein [Paenibacillus sp. CCS19]|uniref:ABC transporter ATP-binding protein n=1 Tax=Paenibacillus sp. CCS19 TaxID=3158387 RepID=UPI0025645117|nr:ABC transporter ATP-binding protein [Paenibacillus cellulosilyticus]GMK40057.1 ABC transporter ATP-binding protein [Paenibacillus cellulosilyticus]